MHKTRINPSPINVAESRDRRALLSRDVEARSTFLDELVIARRIWRSHRDLVEHAGRPNALSEELAQLIAQLAKTREELDVIDPPEQSMPF